jgi:hypothetical protein
MRKGLVYGVVFAACAGWFSAADAAYLIRLKNGKEYVTSRYWQEGGQLFFETAGGILGIEKASVAKIEQSDQPLRLTAPADRQPVQTAPAGSDKPGGDTLDAKKPDMAPKTEKKRDDNDPVVSEFNRLKEKSKEVDGMLTSEIRELLKETTAFKNKLARDSKLFFEYGRELNDAQAIGEVVESALRSRTQ